MADSDAGRRARYLFVEQPLGAFVVNFILNAAIAWGLFRGTDGVPMWGNPSLAGDTIATSAILPFLSVLIATPLVRRDVRHGKVVLAPRPLPGWLPGGTFARAIVFALLGLALAAPVGVLVFVLAGVSHVPMPAFVWVKAAYGAILGAVIAPAIALAAVANPHAGR